MSDARLKDLGENALVAALLQGVPHNAELLVGAGDDCAVVRGDGQWDVLLKTDVLIEGVHFYKGTPPALVGRKALARAVSDIAAMGGLPQHALITLMAHPSCPAAYLLDLYREGIYPLARQYGISIAGGETAALPCEGLIINVALTGRVEHACAVLRSGGREGDILCVSGRLGGSLGSGRHLSFEPRVELARFLMHSPYRPHAMMDISDGLATDLPRLAQASQLSFTLEEDKLPCHEGCCPQNALCDGEDYELLMAFSAEQWAGLSTLTLPTPLHAIGRLQKEGGSTLHQAGWTHFA